MGERRENMNRLAVFVVMLVLLPAFVLNICVSRCQSVEGWIPYIPESWQWWPKEWSLTHWTQGNISCIDVNFVWPDTGYAVSDWGTVISDDHNLWVDTEMWEWTGPSAQVIVHYSHTYELGPLEEGDYAFTMNVWGCPILNISFTIPTEKLSPRADLADLPQLSY